MGATNCKDYSCLASVNYFKRLKKMMIIFMFSVITEEEVKWEPLRI